MNEIKFRAWNKTEGWMDTEFVIHADGHVYQDSYKRWDISDQAIETAYDDLIIMQFIGIRDSSGKDIYEGDIKRWKFNNHVWDFVCYWSDIDCGFRWRMIKHNAKQDPSDINDSPFEPETDFYKDVLDSNQRSHGFDRWSEIIGNIHENPELLK